jgi:hypothetical protein
MKCTFDEESESESVIAIPQSKEALAIDYLHKNRSEHLGSEHLGSEHLGSEHLGSEHLGSEHLGSGLNIWGRIFILDKYDHFEVMFKDE